MSLFRARNAYSVPFNRFFFWTSFTLITRFVICKAILTLFTSFRFIVPIFWFDAFNTSSNCIMRLLRWACTFFAWVVPLFSTCTISISRNFFTFSRTYIINCIFFTSNTWGQSFIIVRIFWAWQAFSINFDWRTYWAWLAYFFSFIVHQSIFTTQTFCCSWIPEWWLLAFNTFKSSIKRLCRRAKAL